MAMTDLKTRRIFKSISTSRTETNELLQAIFVAELLIPSRCIWLVSPWVSDINILDNRTGAFATLEPTWGRRFIRLTEVLKRLLAVGTTLVIAVRSVEQNEQFFYQMRELARDEGLEKRLIIHEKDTLHLKGILGDNFYLSGSMNITFNGIEILEEGINYDINASTIAEARIAFLENYGGIP
jgi:hypothetical protein